MTKELRENAYRTYCRDRLVVSDSVNKVDTDNLVIDKEVPKIGKLKKAMTMFIK